MNTKLEHYSNKMQASTFISTINAQSELQTFIDSLRKLIKNHKNLSISQQRDDLLENIQLIQKQPFLSLQLQRILNIEQQNPDITKYYATFKDVLEDYPISVQLQSKRCLDANYKTNMFSSAIANYQKYLFDLLFVMYCFNFDNVDFTVDFIEDYLKFIHQIHVAQVTTKISLREQATINSPILVEIPRNSIVKFYAHPVNEYWVKVLFVHHDIEIEGYIQSVYLKNK
ncbi:hypothetical protein A7P53_16590 [Acinetobacter defluvii]|uniref:SH3 domain-containing protein n=1 Tax=Acinetobacter defluvii TaxID=1871111 RepID=UPI00148F453D|nr:SH3 domain-containing protein [Acinetobacter defluvii]NNP71391.1 hypothetical protein [Acinetobacter defluvii]